MELIRGILNLKPRHHGCVLTIGNFDGVHLGHQHVLTQLQEIAKRLNLPSVVMTFEPQPLEFFSPNKAPARLTRLRDKYELLKQFGLDRLLCVNFNHAFANLSMGDFITQLLVEKLGVKYLVVGDDFRFGKDRQGCFLDLEKAGQQYGFDVVSASSFCMGEQRVSSTLIRKALSQASRQEASLLLGRDYSLHGRVSHGRKLGRTLGFPTANIPLKRQVSPVNGVYVVRIQGVAHSTKPLYGVANIGTRPSVHGTRQQLEVHLFDYQGDLYGQHLDVALLHKLRNEQKFNMIEMLKQQIELDVVAAKNWLAQQNNS